MTTLRPFTLFFFLFFSLSLFAAENCANGVDDDGDGLIDINDPDCKCTGVVNYTQLPSLIPNKSFEDNSCCPISFSYPGYESFNCADNWIQASGGTSDYLNTCGHLFNGDQGIQNPMFPLPTPGTGFVGYINNPEWEEYVGSCLNQPMLAGKTYVMNFWIAYASGNPQCDFGFWGTNSCSNLPFAGTENPPASYQLLTSKTINLNTNGSWTNFTISYTPTQTIRAVLLGPGPNAPSIDPRGHNYYYLDELSLSTTDTLSGINQINYVGNPCLKNEILTATTDSLNVTWQWYKEGIALIGETNSTLDISNGNYGNGNYTAQLTTQSGACGTRNYVVNNPDYPNANYSNTALNCPDVPINYTDQSNIASGSITNYDWTFGDGGTSNIKNPTHSFTSSGNYTTTLITTSDIGCKDTIKKVITVNPTPNTNFNFSDVCALSHTITFNNTTTISPGSITNWAWDFGDGNSANIKDPSHTYGAVPPYTVSLTATSDQGCIGSIQQVLKCDKDGDGISDEIDLDDDNDGIPDTEEDANTDGDNDPTTNPTDTDNDGIPDYYDLDSDNDGITDAIEAGGNDTNGDGIIDGFTDTNADGWDDATSQNPLPNPDSDNDGIDNIKDIDSDNDGIVDNIEGQTTTGYTAPSGNDADGDGIDDTYDPDATGGTPIQPTDTDNDNSPDYLDQDSDNDSYNDLLEGWDTDGDGIADLTPSGNDSDSDGLDDNFDNNDFNINPTTNSNNNGSTPGVFPNLDDPSTAELDWRELIDTDNDGIPDHEDLDDDNDGIPDTQEDANTDGDNDPTTNPTDTDSDGIADVFDLDSDNDGITDVTEGGGNDTNGDGIIDGFTDTNGDGWDDATSQNPLPNPDSDNDGIDNIKDIDADGDGIVDNIEGQNSSNYTPPLNQDSDGDGIDDAYDPDATGGTPIFPIDTDGDGDNDYVDTNSDNDSKPDLQEGWDTNGDGIPETVPSGNDSDGDGLDDNFDNNDNNVNPLTNSDNNGQIPIEFPNTEDATTFELDWREILDNDNDGIDDDTDLDNDNDGIPDSEEDANTDGDNDPTTNPTDSDNDGIPDVFDLDSDNDGITDVTEGGGNDSDGDGIIDGFTDTNGDGWDDATSQDPLPNPDTDGDGVTDVKDIDSDNDGIVDNIEAQPSDDYISPTGTDSDEDGIDDAYDPDTSDGNPINPTDTDSDGNPDYTDTDSDDDGLDDIIEGWDTNADGTPDTSPSGYDTDGDGLDDNFDINDLNTDPLTNSTNNGSTSANFPNADNPKTQELDWREPTKALIIPEGFSPNGDDVNDLFIIDGIERFPENSIMIFNRWGTLIFQAKPYKNDWDGTSQSGVVLSKNKVPIGTYFYIFQSKEETPPYKGSIELVQ